MNLRITWPRVGVVEIVQTYLPIGRGVVVTETAHARQRRSAHSRQHHHGLLPQRIEVQKNGPVLRSIQDPNRSLQRESPYPVPRVP